MHVACEHNCSMIVSKKIKTRSHFNSLTARVPKTRFYKETRITSGKMISRVPFEPWRWWRRWNEVDARTYTAYHINEKRSTRFGHRPEIFLKKIVFAQYTHGEFMYKQFLCGGGAAVMPLLLCETYMLKYCNCACAREPAARDVYVKRTHEFFLLNIHSHICKNQKHKQLDYYCVRDCEGMCVWCAMRSHMRTLYLLRTLLRSMRRCQISSWFGYIFIEEMWKTYVDKKNQVYT